VSDPLLDLRDIEFAYPGREPLLRGVSLAVGVGERVGLTGANGAGKSTLLHIAIGLLAPRGGTVTVAGERCATERDFMRARRSMGLLFQHSDDQLFCATVEEDLAFGPFNLGLPREEVAARVRDTLDQLGIAPLARRLVHRLSEGEKRLAALGTLLTMRPRLLLLDEPTTGLDDAARARLLEIIARLPSALLIATHDRALLSALNARRLHLRSGLLAE
jgi:cobalt/nickel transport system ATP-binding protein